MTCIVAITDGRRTVMGADSAASTTDNPEIYSLSTSKLWQTGEYLVGICGSYRAGQLARWEMSWPEPPSDPGADFERFMVTEVVKSLRQTLQSAAFVSSSEPARTAQFLVAVRGHLFTINGEFSCGSMAHPWIAIGSGRHHAYGALHAVADLELPLEDKVRRALLAAQAHTANVREPFAIWDSRGTTRSD
jgi:ATP-dependent protease HslVU (ClpYQ) peptidase subunit